ncbi:spore coat U domain-containing protein [Shimia sp. FJ5]|uniref:Csu type fimbrial protein n=1 Tax=Shimia sp. FJ5 TaxID=3079054 RepID=UPI002608FE0B|nr:spore coat U domain-containing protein [Shimia sp. FJ5]MDV4145679.1 spore coat U domain-containing protein [Shimia sp. FJ5]
MKRVIVPSLIAVFSALFLLSWSAPAQAVTCSASITDIDFGNVSLKAGQVNRTTGSLQINCSEAGLLNAIGVCVELGSGSGGAGASNSPRYLQDGFGNSVDYQLRSGGYGSSNPVWEDVFVSIPIVLGSGSTLIPITIYADISTTGVDSPIGLYSSQFSAGSDAQITYDVSNCSLSGPTAPIPSFSVSANVTSACEVDSATLNFGSISGVISSPIDADTQIAVRCTSGTSYDVRLSLGNGLLVTDPAQRKMTSLLDSLRYGLYQDSARTQVWGNSSSNDVTATGTGSNQLFPVYGRIHSGQSVLAGSYSDTVLITVEYN